MIDCGLFYDKLLACGVDFFTGVPDSVLRSFVAYLCDHVEPSRHIIAANEGNAVALAAGYYLSTERPALVYMQNSGQGNAVNPLTSLAASEVYGIPMVLLVGWRGEPGVADEPQHIKQGSITRELFDLLGVPWTLLPDNDEAMEACLGDMVRMSQARRIPVAIIARKKSFAPYEMKEKKGWGHPQATMTREEALRCIVKSMGDSDMVICTTGKASRELYAYREELGGDHGHDFLTVGSMGHASQISLGAAVARPEKQFFCMDGDGAALMHMGGMAIIGSCQVPNLKHIILNNGAHDSVGGHGSAGFSISFVDVAKACGYKTAVRVQTKEALMEKMDLLRTCEGPALLEVVVKKGARQDLGRPETTPFENLKAFVKAVAK